MPLPPKGFKGKGKKPMMTKSGKSQQEKTDTSMWAGGPPVGKSGSKKVHTITSRSTEEPTELNVLQQRRPLQPNNIFGKGHTGKKNDAVKVMVAKGKGGKGESGFGANVSRVKGEDPKAFEFILDLSDRPIDEQMIDQMFDYFSQKKAKFEKLLARDVRLTRCNINNHLFNKIMESFFRSGVFIQKLRLFGNVISSTGPLENYMKRNHGAELMEVHLSHNQLTDEHCQKLVGTCVETIDKRAQPLFLRMEKNLCENPTAIYRYAQGRVHMVEKPYPVPGKPVTIHQYFFNQPHFKPDENVSVKANVTKTGPKELPSSVSLKNVNAAVAPLPKGAKIQPPQVKKVNLVPNPNAIRGLFPTATARLPAGPLITPVAPVPLGHKRPMPTAGGLPPAKKPRLQLTDDEIFQKLQPYSDDQIALIFEVAQAIKYRKMTLDRLIAGRAHLIQQQSLIGQQTQQRSHAAQRVMQIQQQAQMAHIRAQQLQQVTTTAPVPLHPSYTAVGMWHAQQHLPVVPVAAHPTNNHSKKNKNIPKPVEEVIELSDDEDSDKKKNDSFSEPDEKEYENNRKRRSQEHAEPDYVDGEEEDVEENNDETGDEWLTEKATEVDENEFGDIERMQEEQEEDEEAEENVVAEEQEWNDDWDQEQGDYIEEPVEEQEEQGSDSDLEIIEPPPAPTLKKASAPRNPLSGSIPKIPRIRIPHSRVPPPFRIASRFA